MLGAGEHVLVADGSTFACWSSFSVSPFRLRFIRASVFAPCASLSRLRLVRLQHYMGHKNIMHTVRYTDMAPDRFKNFWQD
jgi:type 1 fimbriae regulatory protein FimB/type 1 fimbriae regulatory protein FimE